jgi:hypothetical protein
LAVGRFLGLTGVAGAFAFMLLLHLFAGSAIQPVTETLSNAVFAPQVGWMFPAGVLSMAVGGVGVITTLRASGLPIGRVAMLGAWLTALGLFLVALFPTDPIGHASLSAQIHRYAAAVALVAVPVVALLVAAVLPRGQRGRRMLQAAAMVTGAIVLLTGVAIFLPGTFDPVRGVIQRVQLISELLVLALLIQLSVRCAQHGRRH